MTKNTNCSNNTPPWFVGHWRDWHRGHGCDRDDGKPQTAEAVAEIAQHYTNQSTGYLTDAEMAHLRARTTSGDTLLTRALDELKARRAAASRQPQAFDHAQRTTKLFDPLLGFCVCKHCEQLPQHQENQA